MKKDLNLFGIKHGNIKRDPNLFGIKYGNMEQDLNLFDIMSGDLIQQVLISHLKTYNKELCLSMNLENIHEEIHIPDVTNITVGMLEDGTICLGNIKIIYTGADKVVQQHILDFVIYHNQQDVEIAKSIPEEETDQELEELLELINSDKDTYNMYHGLKNLWVPEYNKLIAKVCTVVYDYETANDIIENYDGQNKDYKSLEHAIHEAVSSDLFSNLNGNKYFDQDIVEGLMFN